MRTRPNLISLPPYADGRKVDPFSFSPHADVDERGTKARSERVTVLLNEPTTSRVRPNRWHVGRATEVAVSIVFWDCLFEWHGSFILFICWSWDKIVAGNSKVTVQRDCINPPNAVNLAFS